MLSTAKEQRETSVSIQNYTTIFTIHHKATPPKIIISKKQRISNPSYPRSTYARSYFAQIPQNDSLITQGHLSNNMGISLSEVVGFFTVFIALLLYHILCVFSIAFFSFFYLFICLF